MSHVSILALETAGKLCAVALGKRKSIVFRQQTEVMNAHARVLSGLIEDVLQQAGRQIGQLEAIAVDIGPGSFTGLRIGMSMAKGLAFYYRLPIIPVSAFAIIAASLPEAGREWPLQVLIDARRNEAFRATFANSADFYNAEISYERTPLAALDDFPGMVVHAGGSNSFEQALSRAKAKQVEINVGVMPDLAIAALQSGQHIDSDNLEPEYGRDFAGVY
jgi:tRNA threonylcarbamoyladenosine biosynthesis protein TsaB